MKCDAKKLISPGGGFTCSILGDTVGADWLWDNSLYKEKILDPPQCDANFIRKKGIFGKKYFFSCWVMGKFKVKYHVEELKSKVQKRIKSIEGR